MAFKLTKSNLNFRVYTAPTIPETGEENDILIVSEIPMKNWTLSPDAPTGVPRTDGDVWIRYSTSNADFNLLKENDIAVKFASAMQYVNGAWVGVTPKSYHNGEWVDWFTGFLGRGVNKLGNPRLEITSGSNDGVLSEASFQTNADGSFTLHMASAINWIYAACLFPNEVGLSEYSTITVKYVIESTNLPSYSNKTVSLDVTSTPDGSAVKSVPILTNKTEQGLELTATLDVSDVTNGYLRLYHHFDEAGRFFTIRIIEIIPN